MANAGTVDAPALSLPRPCNLVLVFAGKQTVVDALGPVRAAPRHCRWYARPGGDSGPRRRARARRVRRAEVASGCRLTKSKGGPQPNAAGRHRVVVGAVAESGIGGVA